MKQSPNTLNFCTWLLMLLDKHSHTTPCEQLVFAIFNYNKCLSKVLFSPKMSFLLLLTMHWDIFFYFTVLWQKKYSFYLTCCLFHQCNFWNSDDTTNREIKKRKEKHLHTHLQTLKWEAWGCTICVSVCYERRAVVQTGGESGIGDWPWGIMFFSLLWCC